MNEGTQTLACNTRLLLEPKDFEKIEALLTSVQEAYNACSFFIKDNNVKIDVKVVHDAVYHWMRERFSLLSSQMIIKVYKEVMAAYRSIRKNKHVDAKTPEKTNLSMRLDKRLYTDLSVDGIRLTGLIPNKRKFVGFEGYGRLWEMFVRYPLSDPLIFIRDGEAWISLPFLVPNKPLSSDAALGIDLGMRRFITTSDGMVFDDKAYKARRRQVRHLKAELRKKGTKSAKRKLKKLKHKEKQQSKDFICRMANAVIASTDAGTLVVEELKNIKKNTAKTENGYVRKKHNSAFSQVALAKFVEILTYKAPLAGKQVVTVSPTWTSQTDSRTDKKDGQRQGRRYICSDGVILDSDWNAAINIAKRSKHPVSKTVTPVDGGLRFFFTGRCESTRRMRRHGIAGPCKPLNL